MAFVRMDPVNSPARF